MITRGCKATETLPLEPELAKTVSDTFEEEGCTSMEDAMLNCLLCNQAKGTDTHRKTSREG